MSKNYLSTKAGQLHNHAPKGSGKWLDSVRELGNDAAHDLVVVKREEAEQVIAFAEMILEFVYEVPGRVTPAPTSTPAVAPAMPKAPPAMAASIRCARSRPSSGRRRCKSHRSERVPQIMKPHVRDFCLGERPDKNSPERVRHPRLAGVIEDDCLGSRLSEAFRPQPLRLIRFGTRGGSSAGAELIAVCRSGFTSGYVAAQGHLREGVNPVRVSTTLLAAGAAVILLSACSSAPQGSTAGLLPTGASGRHVGVLNPLLPNRGKASLIQRKLYVTDNNNNDVAVFKYGKWTSIGTITSGIVSPYADWVDRSGNLYVANDQTNPTNIVEYDSSGNQIFTYSAGIREPAGVTTDKYGNVYEADQYGMVNEYAQGSNVATVTCSLPSGDQASGVAVNRRGGVFVSFYSFSSNSGGIVAYPRGLRNNPYPCLNSLLPVKLFEPIGLVFDTQGNLLVCDANPYVSAVDIIAPPFNSVTGTLGSGWNFPSSVTIDRAGTQVYVTDAGAGVVSIFTYPGGTNVTTLGSADGLSLPVAAVDSKNYVP